MVDLQPFRAALRNAVATNMRPLRDLYDEVAVLFPQQALMMPFPSFRSYMRQWQRDSMNALDPDDYLRIFQHRNTC
ncbi:hypothetical protein TKK_0003046 [Trichogramma kaykai]